MDPLSAQFSQELSLRDIDRCTNVEELKRLTKMLYRSFTMNKEFIAKLLMPKPATAVLQTVLPKQWQPSDALLLLL